MREAMSPATRQSIQLNSPFGHPNPRGPFPWAGHATKQLSSNQAATEVLQTTPQTITDRLLRRGIETNLSAISCEWWKKTAHWPCMHGRAVPAPLASCGRSLTWPCCASCMYLGPEPLRPPFSLSSVEIRKAPRLRDSH
jgi:hypothetical protein